MKILEPVAKVGYFCTGSCSFSPYGLQNCGFQAVAAAKLKFCNSLIRLD
jgi:hypothetical protein